MLYLLYNYHIDLSFFQYTMDVSCYLEKIFKIMRKKNNGEQEFVLSSISTGFFQSAKDFTECMGTMTALFKYMNPMSTIGCTISAKRTDLTWAFKIPINIFVIGDGRDPQMGFLLAKKMPFATVWSIDPVLRSKYFVDNHQYKKKLLDNQRLFAGKIEDFSIPSDHTQMSIIVGVHNHGPVQTLWQTLCGTSDHIIYISLPCCFLDVNLEQEPNMIFEDTEIISPKRTIYLWYSQNI